MDEIEFFSFSTENSRDSPELERQDTPLCWYCKRDTNKRNLICACQCVNSFIHSTCLLLIANYQYKLVCRTCKTRYPVEIRPKSKLNMLRKASVFFFMILFSIVTNFLVGLITIIILSIPVNAESTWISISLKISNAFASAFFTWMILTEIKNWIKRIYELYQKWHRSTYEWILVSHNDNIQNIDDTAI